MISNFISRLKSLTRNGTPVFGIEIAQEAIDTTPPTVAIPAPRVTPRQSPEELRERRKKEAEKIFWTLAESGMEIAESAVAIAGQVTAEHCVGPLTHSLAFLRVTRMLSSQYFVGHYPLSSPATEEYLKNRIMKDAAGNIIETVICTATVGAIPNPFSLGKHANALSSTALHRFALASGGEIAETWSHDADGESKKRLINWLEAIQDIKDIKLGINCSDLVGSVIPPAMVGGLILKLTASAMRVTCRLTKGDFALLLAMDIHSHAYQELVSVRGTPDSPYGGSSSVPSATPRQGRAGPSGMYDPSGTSDFISWIHEESKPSKEADLSISGPYGPASAIMYELFTRRGATQIFGKYDVDRFILEPAGWLALSDKILLM